MEALSLERWQQIKPLLDQLFDLPPEEYTAFLDQHCRDDPTLYLQLRAALDANEKGQDFLSALDGAHLSALLDHLTFHDLVEAVEPETSSSYIGQRIGPYEIIREIAQGGMGTVFLAERADGAFQRQVALKLIRESHASPQVHRRFLAERQILAQLRHVHIARLLDGGMSEDNQPYFVMEYIDGHSITAYCDRRHLGIEGRLRLFGQVCESVKYAHRNLVVHRDLKPGNILVTSEGRVKLLDFGIAKLLADEAVAASTLTRTGMHVMTPAYAAPEQVRGETITTATDVYALGVVLYELLTGHKPHRLEDRSPAALVQAICETVPEAPSTVVDQTEERFRHDGSSEQITPEGVSRRRGVSIEKLRQRLAGDLDTMVLKALKKEPERRYVSAEAFLEDIHRYLAGLPVSAQPDTLGYRMRKFVSRHRLGVAAAIALGVLMVAVMTLSVTFAVVTQRHSRQIAQEASKAQVVKEYLVGLFEVSDPQKENEGGDVTARELLDRGLDQIDELEEEPTVQAEMLHVLGVVHLGLGMYEEARTLLERSLALRRALFGDEHLDVAQSLFDLGSLLTDVGIYDEAEKMYRESLITRRKLFGEEHLAVAASLNDLAVVLTDKGAYNEAERFLREALEMRRKLLGNEHLDVSESLSYLAAVLRLKGEYDETEALHREVLAMRRKLLGDVNLYIAESLNNLAVVLENKGTYDEAEQLQREALKMRRKLHNEEHRAVAIAMDNLAFVLKSQGNYDDAEQLSREALAMFRKLLGDEHPDVAISLHNLGHLFHKKEDYDQAERLLRDALALSRKVFAGEHPRTATNLTSLGRLLLDLNRPDEADSLLRQALPIHEAARGKTDQRTAETRMLLGVSLTALARYEEAELLLLESLAVYESKTLDGELTATRQALFDLYTAWGKPERAAAYRAGS